MSNTLNLAERLTSPATGLDADIWVPLLRLLALGQPVEVGALAAATGKAVPEVIRALASVPDTEYDDAGRIIGQGLTLNPTPHHIEIGGILLYTWCALDTLIFPAILGASARIESACQACGVPVRVTVNTSGATAVEPVSAVVSLVNPEDMSTIRSAFCNQVHFFASPEAAQPWLAAHPGGTIIPVTEAYQLGTTMAENLLNKTPEKQPNPLDLGTDTCCCC
ncbi:organomercurial lyase MerB [Rathayibacter soli]|uniref:organomercurial lyase MerB n=1 Tax=Rathayibacter soli TaxID=3144168 RepID=UPI0027E54144|nr:organomercurial lyase MerB [Glaciibacter superstes]